jgi:XTP/dITP diphosphohydrolase
MVTRGLIIMIKIVVATKNEHKVKELREMLNLPDIEVSTMSDLGIDIDIVEDGSTFEENALKKARELYKYINDKNITVIADDSGLCVDYLNGAPGIYSARYSGGGYSENNSKLLNELKDVPMDKRSAHFSCVIALINQKEEKIFAGTCNGFIALEEKGDNKFGYDPIFLFPETGMTFGVASL